MRIGLISDTHNLLRPELTERLSDCSLIIHAGDVASPELLAALERIAPVIAARGNCDRGTLSELLPERAEFTAGSYRGLVLHDINSLEPDFPTAPYRLIVFGHSHKPEMFERHGTLFLNPGSAGPRRFSLPISMAVLQIDGTSFKPRLITLG